jgi:hypothetical protein
MFGYAYDYCTDVITAGKSGRRNRRNARTLDHLRKYVDAVGALPIRRSLGVWRLRLRLPREANWQRLERVLASSARGGPPP